MAPTGSEPKRATLCSPSAGPSPVHPPRAAGAGQHGPHSDLGAQRLVGSAVLTQVTAGSPFRPALARRRRSPESAVGQLLCPPAWNLSDPAPERLLPIRPRESVTPEPGSFPVRRCLGAQTAHCGLRTDPAATRLTHREAQAHRRGGTGLPFSPLRCPAPSVKRRPCAFPETRRTAPSCASCPKAPELRDTAGGQYVRPGDCRMQSARAQRDTLEVSPTVSASRPS